MLVTLDDTKNYLGIDLIDTTYDTFLNGQIALFSSTIENYCQRKFEQASYTQEFYYDQFSIGMNSLYTYHYPIISVASIKEIYTIAGSDEETLIESQQYRAHNPSGKIDRFSEYGVREAWFYEMCNQDYARTQVIYDAGYATIPAEIQHVCFQLIEQEYNKKKSGVALSFGSDVQRLSIPGVMSIDFDYSLQNNERTSTFGMFLKGYANILDPFRSERALGGSIVEGYVS